MSVADQDANAARIVACVNALAGVEDPAAYLAEAKRMAHAYACKITEHAALRGACELLDSLDLAVLVPMRPHAMTPREWRQFQSGIDAIHQALAKPPQ